MYNRTIAASLPSLLATALLVAGCRDSLSPERRGPVAPAFAAAGQGIVLDQVNGKLNDHGTEVWQNFEPTNPHVGDAIIATFLWVGSTNTIDSVTDVLTTVPFTPVGNKYTLVEYVTAGGVSMATYVATNVQNFPDAYSDPSGTYSLAVRADFSAPVVDGGIVISAWTGVNAVAAQAVGAHNSASGSGSTATVADPGAVPVGAGALVYAMTLSTAEVGRTSPAGFINLAIQSDPYLVDQADYAVQASAGSVDPQWTWDFTSPSSWAATVLVLNPDLHLAFTVQPSTTPPGMTIKPAVQVTALDAQGNPVTSFTGPVTIALAHNGGLLMPGTLSGTKTVAAVNGVATFSDLSIDQLGNGYTLFVTASGLAGRESAPFNIGVM